MKITLLGSVILDGFHAPAESNLDPPQPVATGAPQAASAVDDNCVDRILVSGID